MPDVSTLYLKVNSKEVAVGKMQLASLGKQAGDTAKQVDRLANTTNKSITQMSSSFKVIGRDLSRYVTLPLLAAGAASIKFSTDLTKGMGQVETLIAGTGDRIYELQTLVTDLSKETGRGFDDLTAGLYQTISAFQDGADTAGRFETAVKAGVAGAASTSEAIGLLSAVTKAYGDTTEEATKRVADLAFSTVKYGVTTFQQLAAAIQQVTAVSAMLGVSQRELFSVYATLTGVGGDAAQVTTGFNRALLSLMNPTGELIKLYAQYSDEQGNVVKSGEDFIRVMGGAVPALQEIARVAEATGKPIQKFITRQTGVRVALLLAGEQAEVFAQKSMLLARGVGSANEAYLAATQGINLWQVELSKALQTLKSAGAEIGQILLPHLVNMVKGIANAAEAFTRLDESTQNIIIRIAGIAAALGPLLIMFGSVLKMANTLKTLNIAGVLAKIGPALASPAGLIAIVVLTAAIVALNVVLKKNREYVEGIADAVTSSEGMISAYERLNTVVAEGHAVIAEGNISVAESNKIEHERLQLVYDFLQAYPEIRGELGLYNSLLRTGSSEIGQYVSSMEELLEAMRRVNEQNFMDAAGRDVRQAKKAARDFEVASSGLQEVLEATIGGAFEGLSSGEVQREAERAVFQITSEAMWGGFDDLDQDQLRDRLMEILNIDAGDIDFNVPFGAAFGQLTDLIGSANDFSSELEQLNEIASDLGLNVSDIDLEEGGNLRSWQDYILKFQYASEQVAAAIDDPDGDGIGGAGGAGDVGKRLKTWADYFAEITGIAGEAFAQVEYDEKGNAVGFIQGSGKLAADAYAKAFADELALTTTISDAIGLAFSIEDQRDMLGSQLDKTTSDLFDLLNEKVRSGEINTEGLDFNIADLLTGDEASVVRMLEVFGLADSSIKDMIADANALRQAFNSANLAVILGEVNDELIDFRTNADNAFSFQQDVDYFNTLQEQAGILAEEIKRIKDEAIIDVQALREAILALIEINEETEGVADSFGVVASQMAELPSVAEIASEAMYDLARSIGLSAEASWAMGEVFGGVAGAMVDQLGQIASGFGEVYGQMLAGADVADRWDNIMGSFALSIAETLSALAIQAGLTLIIAGASTYPAVNWALIGMGSAFLAGGMAGQFATSAVQSYASEKETQANASGGVYSGNSRLTKYAKGGVLGDYVNSIVSKPTYFANGSALMGEAGDEAIMPLTRDSNGDLAVSAVGAGGGSTTVSININNYASDSTTATAKQNSDGSVDVNIVKKMVASAIADGSTDNAMRSRYGTKVRGLN